MARLVYTFTLWLALPLVLARLWWRARGQPGYLQHRGERFGRYATPPTRPVIWLHAVSVGETRAAQPLLAAVAARYPGHELLLTCMTPTGRASALALRQAGMRVVYLPYDYPFAVRRFLAHFRPRIGLLLETEVWPNLLALCAEGGVPMALVNARLSERSYRRYLRFASLARPAFGTFTQVGAQSTSDCERIQTLGAVAVSVTGNLKFDVTPDSRLLAQGAAWRSALGVRKVVLAASTREGEEALLMPLLKQLAALGYFVVVVPRHPQRFDQVTQLAAAAGLMLARRSAGALPAPALAGWLGDSMGEMPAYYALADCAYIGGSLLPLGGQNLIEAAACGCPAVIGPHTWNFSEAADAAVAAGAALRVADVAGLAQALASILTDDALRTRMIGAAGDFAAAHRGASARTMALIEPLLARSQGRNAA